MNEQTIKTKILEQRAKELSDWGLSVETAGTDQILEDLLNRVSFKIADRYNTKQSLFIGLLAYFGKEFSKLKEEQIKQFIGDGFTARGQRKRKLVPSGIISRDYLESEFENGGRIYDWLIKSKILKKLNNAKGYFNSIDDQQKEALKSQFPNQYARVLAILEITAEVKNEPLLKRFYQRPGIESWQKI